MAKSILCPYCFESFDNTDVMVQCRNNSTIIVDGVPTDMCELEMNQRFNQHWGQTVMSKHVFYPNIGWKDKLFGFKVKDYKCDKCGTPSTKFVCPHCNNKLPTRMIENGSEIISVIGGPASGKSNYIVTLIDQMIQHGRRLNFNSPNPEQVGRTEEEYTSNLFKNARKSIFTEHTPVAKTPVSMHPIPWIFELTSNSTKKTVYLVFYDTAGESFRNPDEIEKKAKYLEKSKAVIVLLDTLSLPYIKKILESKNIVNQDLATPFSDTINALRNFVTENPQLKKKPFAFVMSKFDAVIRNKEDLEFDVSAFNDNSSFIKTGVFSLKEIDDASNMIKSYMEEHWDEGALGYDVTHIWGDNARFFGVSALGNMVKEMKIDISDNDRVKPFRVMDPLIWVLHKIGGFGIPVDNK